MSLNLGRLYRIVISLTLLALVLSMGLTEKAATWELPLFILLMVLTGLPHGATDHLVDRFRQEQQGKSFNWGRFLAVYLGAMLIYGLAWLAMPLLSLIIFIFISAYHFGQSQFLYVKEMENSPLKGSLYLSWGLAILTAIIGLNPAESGEVLAALLPQSQWMALESVWIPLLVITGTLSLGLMTYLWSRRKLGTQSYLLEWLHLGLLVLLSWQASLLVSFAVYFGLWHSVASIQAEIRILRQERPNFGWKDFFRAALPFSLISFAGIGLLLGAAFWMDEVISPYLLFFMAISVLTLPHMVFMQGFYLHGRPLLPDFQ